MVLNVLNLRPEDLADTVDPSLVEEALRELRGLDDAQKDALAYALDYWIVQTIERPTDRESTLLLDRICAIAVRLSGDEPSTAEFRVRLETFRDLLETKRQAIAARESRQRPLQAKAVLAALQPGSLNQTELGQRLGLSAGRISQVLAVMEERGLIQRVRKGRESLVSIPKAGGTPVSTFAGSRSAPPRARVISRKNQPRNADESGRLSRRGIGMFEDMVSTQAMVPETRAAAPA